jgi:hypothetical protein
MILCGFFIAFFKEFKMKVYIARDKKTKNDPDYITISDSKLVWNKNFDFWQPETEKDSPFNYFICYTIFCIVSKIRLKKGQQRYLDIELIGKEIIE